MRLFLILSALAIVIPLAIYWFFPRQILYWVRDRLRARARLSLASVSVGDFAWPYLHGGPRGAPPLVLVHGFGGDKDNWAMLAPHLTDHYHVIVPDLLGFGDNARATTVAYDIRTQTDRLMAFLDALSIQQCHLVGNSMGGWIALQAALDHPDRLTTLTLVNNAGVIGKQESELQQMPRTGISPLVAVDAPDLRRLMAFISHQPRFIPGRFLDVIFEDRGPSNNLHDQIFWTIVEDGEQRPLNDRLGEVTVPTLVIWGQNDRLISVSCVAELDAGIATCETAVFDNTGHVPMIEKPRATAAAMRRFLAKHGH